MAIDSTHVRFLHGHRIWKKKKGGKKASSLFLEYAPVVILPSCPSPSHPQLLRPPPLLTLPLGCYISWAREERSLCFSAVIGWDELSCVSVPITSSSAGCRKREGAGSRRGKERSDGKDGVLLLPGTLIRLRRRPLSQYSQNRQHQRGSVWHTGKVIMTVGVSLEWTNHRFTRLNGDVQKRRSRGHEQSLNAALSSEGRWKRSREFIGLKCSVYTYANNCNTITTPQSEKGWEFKDFISKDWIFWALCSA